MVDTPTRARRPPAAGAAATLSQREELRQTRALYETTQEICSRLDLDQVLSAIVRRAYELLDGDVAYLAVCDDRAQVLRLRAFHNIRSPRFRALVIPYGVGLGGAVAALRRPVTSSDYLHDEGVDHSGLVDDAVIEEGLVSVVAVPVEYQARMLGILFVAKRRRAVYGPNQVTLLSGLANSAAIAINNAQLHGRLARSMTIHQTLMEAALVDRGPQPLVEALASLIQGPVLLLDGLGEQLAAGVHDGRTIPLPAPDALRALDAGGDRSRLPAPRSGSADLEVAVIRLGGTVEAFLVVEAASGSVDDGEDLRALAVEQARTVVALEVAKIRSAEQAQMQLRGDLLDRLLAHSVTDEPALIRQALRLGCDLRLPHAVAVASLSSRGADGPDVAALRRLGEAAAWITRRLAPGTLVVARNDTVVFILQAADGTVAEHLLLRLLDQAGAAAGGDVVAGLGSVVGRPADDARSYHEACRALDTARHGPGHRRLVTFDSLDFHQLLLGTRTPDDLRDMAARVLEPLLRHDAEHRGALLTTLRTYIEQCGNLEAASRRLGVHSNTLRNRVDRIASLLGRDLTDARARLDLHLALEVISTANS